MVNLNLYIIMDLDIVHESLDVDKTMEGIWLYFHQSLNHIVYPFYTSDDYRITISGNIHLQGQ
jgi:hypothetical protein